MQRKQNVLKNSPSLRRSRAQPLHFGPLNMKTCTQEQLFNALRLTRHEGLFTDVG